MNMYMRRRQALATIGTEAEDRDGQENTTALVNAIAQVKVFAEIMNELNL